MLALELMLDLLLDLVQRNEDRYNGHNGAHIFHPGPAEHTASHFRLFTNKIFTAIIYGTAESYFSLLEAVV